MKVVLIVLGVLFLLMAVGVVGLCTMIQSVGEDMRPVAHGVLSRLDAEAYAEIHAAAAPEFRQEVPLEQLSAFGALRKRALGAYQGIDKMTGVHVSTSSETGERGEISVDVDYANGRTKAKFKFQKLGDVWKLVGFDVTIPDGLTPAADPLALEAIARELLGMMAEKKLVALYERFSPELKEDWGASTFQDQVLGIVNSLGALTEATLESNAKGDDGYYALQFHAKFEQGERTVRIRFLERNAAWSVLGFVIDPR